MVKSPLRYPGGKSRAIKMILPCLPQFDEFREPFIGGGSVFLAVKQLQPASSFWINDIYPTLYDFWQNAQNNSEKMIGQIRFWKTQFSVGKELYAFLNQNFAQFNSLERAAAFFIYNRITFSGTTLSGGYSEQAFQNRFTESSIQRLEPFAKLLPQTRISNLDYEEVISETGKNVFLFLDPPYYSASKSALYGKNGDLHKGFNHERLAEVLKYTPHKWLMTYDDCKYIRSLYPFAQITSWDLSYGMRNVSKNSSQLGKELFISNYDIQNIQQLDLFQ